MKQCQTVDGVNVRWLPKSTNRKISNLQQKAIDVVRSILPTTPLITECKIPIHQSRRPRYLYGDILLVKYGVLIEVNGAQHQQQSHHFHGDRYQYDTAKSNDELKSRWCDINGLTLVVLNFNEDMGTWKNKIVLAINRNDNNDNSEEQQ